MRDSSASKRANFRRARRKIHNAAPNFARHRAGEKGIAHMKESTKRSMVRWLHIILAIPIIGYIYSPFDVIPQYAAPTRYVFLPTMVISGLWMWKGHVVRRWFTSKPAVQ